MNRILREGGSIFWRVLIVLFAIALLATVIIPQRKMKQDEFNQKLTRLHLVDLYLAEQFFFQGRQYYTSDIDSLLSYINNVRSLRIDTVGVDYYAVADTIRSTDMWRIVAPRERIRSPYVSPVDSSSYIIIVKENGVSVTIKDRHGLGRIENGEADWLEGRKRGQ